MPSARDLYGEPPQGAPAATPGTGCPTGGLVGCCTPSHSGRFTMETCYYAPIRAAQAEKGCALQGAWSPVP